jgi:hypothetical protein
MGSPSSKPLNPNCGHKRVCAKECYYLGGYTGQTENCHGNTVRCENDGWKVYGKSNFTPDKVSDEYLQETLYNRR